MQETITAGTVTTTSYTYDAVGNRLSQNSDGVVTVYSYDANDRLLSAGAESFSYDNNGNTLSKGSETYSWDFDDRLVGFSKPGVTASYTYDPDGLRVARTVNGALTRQLVDHNQSYAQVLEERDGSGALQTRYTYGADLLAQTRSGAETFYHYDALGSTRGLTDPSGGLTDSYTYRAFGEMLEQSGGTTNDYRFTGEQYAPEADAYYLRARWMKPGLGRFLSSDRYSIDERNTIEQNGCQYARLNPILWTDFSGQATYVDYSAKLDRILRVIQPAVRCLGGVVATEVASQGIYILVGTLSSYAGQSLDVRRRVRTHATQQNKKFFDAIKVSFPKAKTKLARERIEQVIIQLLELENESLSNKVRRPARRDPLYDVRKILRDFKKGLC